MIKGTALLVTIVGLLNVMCVLVECGCVFEGEEHEVGKVWHTKTFGTCVNCTCILSENGLPELKCVNTGSKCPKVTCATPKQDPKTCCPYCEDIPNIPPTVSADEDESSSNKRESCTSPSGKVYKDGDYFSSNHTGLRPTKDNQCVMCNCQNGQSLCFLKTCPLPNSCSAFVDMEDDCCPVCADCMEASGIKKNGSSWHPSIASIGEITCFTCTCLNGDIKCERNCIPDHELPCRNPHKPSGECCRTCPDGDETTGKKNNKKSKDKNRKDRKGQKRRKKDRKGNKGRKGKKDKNRRKNKCNDPNIQKDPVALKRCNRRHRRRKDSKTTRHTLRPTPAAGIDLATLCIKHKRTAYLVYKAVSDTEMMIAFDEIKAGTVDVYRWTVNTDNEDQRSVVTYTEPETLQASEFRRQINNQNVVGTTGSSQYRKFKQRLKDKLEKCQTDCEPQLFIKILQRVKVRLLKFGDKC